MRHTSTRYPRRQGRTSRSGWQPTSSGWVRCLLAQRSIPKHSSAVWRAVTAMTRSSRSSTTSARAAWRSTGVRSTAGPPGSPTPSSTPGRVGTSSLGRLQRFGHSWSRASEWSTLRKSESVTCGAGSRSGNAPRSTCRLLLRCPSCPRLRRVQARRPRTVLTAHQLLRLQSPRSRADSQQAPRGRSSKVCVRSTLFASSLLSPGPSPSHQCSPHCSPTSMIWSLATPASTSSSRAIPGPGRRSLQRTGPPTS